MAEISPSSYSAILIPDERRALTTTTDGTAPSTITQAGPTVGVAEDQSSPASSMVFETSGTQSANKTLVIQGHKAGFPGVSTRAGGIIWQYDGDASTEWRGADPPLRMTGAEYYQYALNAGLVEASKPHVIRLQNGNLLSAHHYSATGVTDTVRVKSMTLGGSWTTIATITPSSNHPDLNPCLVQLPDGRVLCFMWSLDTAAATANIVAYQSADNGDTWSLSSPECLTTAVSTATYSIAWTNLTDYGKLRAAYSNGQILLFASVLETATPRMIQLASDNLGASFTTVYTWASTDQGAGADVLVTSSGAFLVIWDDNTSGLSWAILSSAYEALSSADANTITAAAGIAACSSAWTDEDGTHYLSYIQATTFRLVIERSIDDGQTWGSGGNALAGPGMATTDTHFHLSGATSRGRGVLLSAFDSAGDSTTDDWSLTCIYLGGSTTLTLPNTSTSVDVNVLNFFQQMAGWATGTDTATAKTSGGTPTETFASTGYNIAMGVGDTLYWTNTALLDSAGNAATSDDQEYIAFFDVTVNAGGSTGSDAISFEILAGDANHDYRVSIRMTTTGFAAYDVHGAANIGTATVDMTAGVQALAALRGGNGGNDGVFVMYYRLRVAHSASDRSGWTTGPSSVTVTEKGGAPLGTERIQWGGRTASAGGEDHTWHFVSYGALPSGTQRFTSAVFVNPDDLFPRPVSRHPIGIDDGVRVAAVSGPLFYGEQWKIATRYQYPIDNLDPDLAPSPRRVHRTTAETQEEYIWDLVGYADTARMWPSTSLAIYAGNVNWRTASIWGGDAAGSFSSLMDLDTASGQVDLEFTRDGDVIRVNTAASSDGSDWLTFNSFVGGTAELDTAGTPVRRKILRHTAGRWTDDATARPEFVLDGTLVGDPTSGLCRLWAPRIVGVVHNANEYRYIKLRINAQSTADGYLQTGIAFPGALLFFAQRYGWGRTLSLSPNTSLTTTRAGSRFARKLGPARRRVAFSWPEGVDSLQLYNSALVLPDYIRATSTAGSDPVGAIGDTAFTVSGVVDLLAGSAKPVVYLPHVPRGTPDTLTLTGQNQMLFGRIVSDVRLENVLGNEEGGEKLRVGTTEIEEEV